MTTQEDVRPVRGSARGLLVAAAVLLAAGGAAQEGEPTLDQGAAALGRQTYRSYCASCHGSAARGDGPLAEHLRTQPSDLTRLSAENGGTFPFELVIKVIDGREGVKGHGSADMPAWGDAFSKTAGKPDEVEVEKRINRLAHFIWSLQAQGS